MQYRQLGRTGIRLSRVGLGCGNFGGVGSAPEFFGMGENEAQAFRLMDEAADLGVNFFDTADAYGGGRSETTIGKWLKTKPPQVRDQILISSKVFNPVGPGPNDWGLSRRHILRQVDRSLGRLGLERLDLYLIHEPDPTTPLEETLGALDDLVRMGKIHYVGASNIEAWRLAKALWTSDKLGKVRFQWVQSSYSLLDRSQEKDILPLCGDQGLGYTPFSPLAGGWLTGKYQAGKPYPPGSRMTLRPQPYAHLVSETTFQALGRLQRAAQQRNVAMPSLALAWVLEHPQVTSTIVGPRRPEHFNTIREALEIQLTTRERDELTACLTRPDGD